MGGRTQAIGRRWRRSDVRAALRWHLLQRPGRVVMVLMGTGLTVASFWQREGRDAFASLALVLGVALVVIGCILPWIVRLRISPGGGVDLQMREGEQTEVAADAATETFMGEVEDDEVLGTVRWILANEIIPFLLTPTDGPLAGAEFRLFLYDADLKRLLPAFGPPGREPSSGWPLGTGVTGAAYKKGEYMLALGDETHDGTFGLDEEQQRRYSRLKAVAAMPIFTASDEVIGVLSASTSDEAHPGFTTDEGFDEHLLLAQKVGRILIDLLKWFDDDPTRT